MNGVVDAVAAWVVGMISVAGYVGIIGLMAAESACTPLPSEIIMPFAGYLASTGRLNLVLAATAGAVGCNLGLAIAYAVGAYGGRPAVLRWGRCFLVGADEVDRAERFFRKFGGAAVFVGRMLPLVRTFIALPAGLARMNVWRFHLYTFAGSWPWCYGLAYVGYVLGKRWNSDPALKTFMQRFDLLVLAAFVLCVGWYLWWRLRQTERPARS